jgi:hypothetical protein
MIVPVHSWPIVPFLTQTAVRLDMLYESQDPFNE